MSRQSLTLRTLNRTTLARQLLLRRQRLPVVRSVERLAGLQAQLPRPPFVGLWSRLAGFERHQLTRAIEQRVVVRGTLMRGTIHLVSRSDYVAWRPTIQPVLTRVMTSVLGKALDRVDVDRIIAVARARFDRETCTFAELRRHLLEELPGVNAHAMGLIVRMCLPLVLVPEPAHPWAYHGAADFAVASSWLDESIPTAGEPERLALRYLAAFGPASGQDFQSWSGLPGGRAVLESLRPKLRVRRSDDGRELFDLPGARLADPDEEPPVRFLPDYDSVLLAYADRRRIVHVDHRKHMFTRNLLVPASFLVDGVAAGSWVVETATKVRRKEARLILKPFGKLDKRARTSLEEEGDRLLRFIEPDAERYAV